DWSKWLPCDRAVAMPCETTRGITPYTGVIAMEAGWRWRIPLQHRTGNGYVHASAFISEEDATAALVEAVEGERIADPRVLRFRATERSDSPFWDYVRTMEIPDSLSEKLELFRRRGRVVKYREGVFLEASWIAVYLGQRVYPQGHDLRAEMPAPDALARGMETLHG